MKLKIRLKNRKSAKKRERRPVVIVRHRAISKEKERKIRLQNIVFLKKNPALRMHKAVLEPDHEAAFYPKSILEIPEQKRRKKYMEMYETLRAGLFLQKKYKKNLQKENELLKFANLIHELDLSDEQLWEHRNHNRYYKKWLRQMREHARVRTMRKLKAKAAAKRRNGHKPILYTQLLAQQAKSEGFQTAVVKTRRRNYTRVRFVTHDPEARAALKAVRKY